MDDKNRHLPAIALEFLLTPRGAYCGTQVRQFHFYIQQQRIKLPEISSEIIATHLSQKKLHPKTARVYKCQLISYLAFLFRKEKIYFDPSLLRSKSKPLPIAAPARPFLDSKRGRHAGTAVRKFHKYLEKNAFELKDISPDIVKIHLDHRLKNISPSTGAIYRLQLIAYLDFLYGKNKILFEPEILRAKPEANPLPEISQIFLKVKGQSARSTVLIFHNWLKTKGIEPSGLTIELVNEFHNYRLETISKISGKNYWYNLLAYLDYLYNKKEICFDPAVHTI
jgi:hypothetical protein